MSDIKPQSIWRFIAATGSYGVLAFLVFRFNGFSLLGYKIIYALWPVLAACGVYVLSRRWLSSWLASLCAGAAYGFGPYGLSFLKLHPAAGMIVAATPWLFLPAVWWHHNAAPTVSRWLGRALFCLLPLVFEIIFVWFTSLPFMGNIRLSESTSAMQPNELLGLLHPFAFIDKPLIFGLYPVTACLCLFGGIVYLVSQRISLLILPLLGLLMAFFDPIYRVSPYFWLTFPMLFLAILSGLGTQAVVVAGKPDNRWVLLTFLLAIGLASSFAVAFLKTKSPTSLLTACFYGLGVVLFGFEWFCIMHNWRMRAIRQSVLIVILSTQFYLAATWLADKFI